MSTSVIYSTTGTQTLYGVPFPYIDKAHVFVTLNGVALTGYTWETSGSIRFTSAPNGSLRIYRSTPEAALTSYQAGSTLTSDELETDSLQALYRAEELQDQVDLSLKIAPGVTGFDPTVPTPVGGNFVMVRTDGHGLAMGNPVGAGDMLLRSDLATSIGATMIGTKRTEAGAIKRTSQAKQAEHMTPEDFGAVGDDTDHLVSEWLVGGTRDRGYANLAAIQVDFPHVTALTDQIDWAAMQAAINNAAGAAGKVVYLSGKYRVNRGLVLTPGVDLRGSGWYSDSATFVQATTGCFITATAAIASIINVGSPTTGNWASGARVSGLVLVGNGLAQRCIYLQSANYFRGENLFLQSATRALVEYDEYNGKMCFRNVLDHVWGTVTAAAACAGAHGVWYNGTVVGSGIVQCVMRSVYMNTKNGHGWLVGIADNNLVEDFLGAIITGGTGDSIRLGSSARNNVMYYTGGIIRAQADSWGNRVIHMTAETAKVIVEGNAQIHYEALDHSTGALHTTRKLRMSEKKQLPPGLWVLSGAAVHTMTSTYVPAINFADTGPGSAAVSFVPEDWGAGTITGVEVIYSMPSVSSAGLVAVFNTRVISRAVAGSLGTVDGLKAENVPIQTTGQYVGSFSSSFATPVVYTPGDTVIVNLERTPGAAADTITKDVYVHSVNLIYRSNGPIVGSTNGPFNYSPTNR